MLLDIKLIKTTSMYCPESAAASVSTWLNRNYEMMFCRMWGFDFLQEDPGFPGVIGKRITAGFNEVDMLKLYKIYHGITTNVQQIKHINVVDKIKHELKKGMPVGVFLHNHEYCFQGADTVQNPVSGFILIIGQENDTFIYLDIGNNILNTKSLPTKNFLKSEPDMKDNRYILLCFSVVGNEQKEVTFKDFFLNFKKNIVNQKNAFESMRSLAECIGTKLNLDYERCDIKEIYYIPLLYNIMQVLRARKLLSSTLNYIWRKTDNAFVYDLAMEFMWIGGEWNLIWNLLNKSYYIQELSNDKLQKLQLRIANKINEIASNEELLVDKILNHYVNRSDNKLIRYNENEVSSISNSDNIIFIDVSNYINNKAFAVDESNNEGADFTGQGEFFLRCGLPDDNMFGVDGMRFLLTSNKGFDNILCRNQMIKIPPGNYQRIIFLGCSEWGEGSGQVKIFYSNGHIENIFLNLPDWYNNGAIEVTRVWKGQIIGLNHCKDERSLFAVSYLLNREVEIEKIQLPDTENIHIFAISLEKYGVKQAHENFKVR